MLYVHITSSYLLSAAFKQKYVKRNEIKEALNTKTIKKSKPNRTNRVDEHMQNMKKP